MSRGDREELRFSLNERLQHVALMVCVIALVVTGLSLTFVDTWLGRVVIDLEGGMEARGLWHRTAAVGVIALCFYHLLYVVFTVRGHDQLMAIMPHLRDLRDLYAAVRFNLGLSGRAPRFGRFDVRQKFQYWAVALATWTMLMSGLPLWFESPAMAVMPKWILDVALAVHSGEGILIFVVLFVWHLYDTHLRPGVFPMDRSWLTGRLTTDELKERHPLEYERIFGQGEKREAV